jgi:hypothetical protein
MNYYQTARNDRRRRRNARLITALITLSLLALAAYSFGAFDALLETEVPKVMAKVA